MQLSNRFMQSAILVNTGCFLTGHISEMRGLVFSSCPYSAWYWAMREVHGQVMLLAGCSVLWPDLQHALLCAALLPLGQHTLLLPVLAKWPGYKVLDIISIQFWHLLTRSDPLHQCCFCTGVIRCILLHGEVGVPYIPQQEAEPAFSEHCLSFCWKSGNWNSWERCFCEIKQPWVSHVLEMAAAALTCKEAPLQSVFLSPIWFFLSTCETEFGLLGCVVNKN